jgi:predicted MPP superfamily phosphohydrolase
VNTRHLGIVALALTALVGLDACLVEPHLRLVRREHRLALQGEPLRLVHLSDLHVAAEGLATRRLLRAVAAAHPDAIVVTGDVVKDTKNPERLLAHARAARAVLTQLAASAPVLAVQGHSEYVGPVMVELGQSGVRWLSNEGTLLPGRSASLLLGLNQQVGENLPLGDHEPLFQPIVTPTLAGFGRLEAGRGNHFVHFDPAPAQLADTSGALAWSGYELACEILFLDDESEGGVVLHSRYVLGEDRFLAFARANRDSGAPPRFLLVPHGSGFDEGETDTGLEPEPGRWYRLRVRTEVSAEAVVIRARIWPAEAPEPPGWQVLGRDRSSSRLTAGTFGLWARDGRILYRHLAVRDLAGEVRFEESLTTGQRPAGFRDGLRGTRLELALARSPQVPRGTPRIVLAHSPDVALEAADRGLDAVLAGHTHGGQVRVPRWPPFGTQALTTRSRLGAAFDRGLFRLPARTLQGWMPLAISAGFGTSLLPIRFLCPPEYTVVELGRRPG